jgi:hypothetical protein
VLEATSSHQPSKVDLANQQAHDLEVGLTALPSKVLTCPAARDHPRLLTAEDDQVPLAQGVEAIISIERRRDADHHAEFFRSK